MIMQANSDSPDPTIESLFPADEGRTKTLGVNFPPSIAAAIRRTGNRTDSISDRILSIIDPNKLEALIRADAKHQDQFRPRK